MPSDKTPGEIEAGRQDDERWALIQRITASRHFAKATQLREFLLFVARRSLAGNEAEISEKHIASEVLGRGSDFDPAEDNIVRVQARHLRQKLDEYFAAEGRNEPLVVNIPRGAYVPHFELRTAAVVRETEAPRSHAWIWVLSCVLLVLYVPIMVVWFRTQRLQRPPDAGWRTELSQHDPVWSRVFVRDQQTSIVVPDTCVGFLQDYLRTDISLGQYSSSTYPQAILSRVGKPELRNALNSLLTRQYTSLGALTLASRLVPLGARLGAKVVITYARDARMREFKTGNYILLGGHHTIPWAELFEEKSNFCYELDEKTKQAVFRNKSPLPGELRTYESILHGTNELETYAAITLAPGLDGRGTVLLLTGLRMEAVEAAGEYLLGEDSIPELTKRLAASPSEAPRHFELLMRVIAVSGASRDVQIVASRLHQASSTAVGNQDRISRKDNVTAR